MVTQFLAMVFTIWKELKTAYTGVAYFFKLTGDITRTIVLAWIVYIGVENGLVAYICVGAPLFTMWTGMVAMGGWSLGNEIYGKTLDPVLISNASVKSVLFGKTVAQMLNELLAGGVALVTVLVIAGEVPRIARAVFYSGSILFALFGLCSIAFFFAPLVVMAGGKAGFFMGIVPFGGLLGGLVLPVNHMPASLQSLAALVPSSWAMKSVWLSATGSSTAPIISNWGMCFLLSLIWMTVTYFMCDIVENRIRIKGNLGEF